MSRPERIHATTIAIGEDGVLLRGPSGAGKSDLALRLVLGGPWAAAGGRPIDLVADDQTIVEAEDGRLIAHAPGAIAGRIEVRGIGIVPLACRPRAALALAVELVAREDVERFPDPPARMRIAGLELACIALHAFDASAPLKLILALDRAAGRLPGTS